MAFYQSYDIHFYDDSGTRQYLLQIFRYLEFHQRVNSPWNHVIRIEVAAEDTNTLAFFRDTLVRDFLIEIYRTDEVTGDKDRVYEGFHRTLVDQVKNTGIVVFTLYGTGYTQLLKRRIVIPASGEEHSAKSGQAEVIIKEFVDEQAVSPTDTDRIIEDLTIDPDLNIGGTAEYKARYTNLFTVVSRLAEQGEVDFGITRHTTAGTFILYVFELWGNDKTVGNTSGIPPVIFDLSLGNMLIPIFSKNGGDEVNFVYVGGRGVGTGRTIETFQNASAVAVSRWNRHENFIDARSEDTTDGLETRGSDALDVQGYKETLTFNVQQTLGTRWLRDWVLGDLITARYAGQQFDKKIIEVSVTVSSGETGSAQIEGIAMETEDYE